MKKQIQIDPESKVQQQPPQSLLQIWMSWYLFLFPANSNSAPLARTEFRTWRSGKGISGFLNGEYFGRSEFLELFLFRLLFDVGLTKGFLFLFDKSRSREFKRLLGTFPRKVRSLLLPTSLILMFTLLLPTFSILIWEEIWSILASLHRSCNSLIALSDPLLSPKMSLLDTLEQVGILGELSLVEWLVALSLAENISEIGDAALSGSTLDFFLMSSREKTRCFSVVLDIPCRMKLSSFLMFIWKRGEQLQ